ncbi:hypothetical protein I4U23_024141 [Adineta vaga]|nr:hypothetical protein I4U23_024141 [Adineta vaga]
MAFRCVLSTWLLLMIIRQVAVLSYNQPKFCRNATWAKNASTFANKSTVGSDPTDMFIDIDNTIYLVDKSNSHVLIWFNNSNNLTQTLSNGLDDLTSIFVAANNEIYIYNNYQWNYRVEKWNMSANMGIPVMYIDEACSGLFVDIGNTLYCSMYNRDQVVKRWLNDNSNKTTIAAGTGNSGSALNQLDSPRRIFVDTNFDLYVADSGNDRIQLFRLGQLNGTTVAGNIITSTISPTASIMLSTTNTSDTTDILKEQTTSIENMTPVTSLISTEQVTTTNTPIINQTCFSPTITLIPGSSTLSSPLQFRRSQDFNIVSIITLNCNTSLSMLTQWTIKNCTFVCSYQIQLDSTIITTLSELYIPGRTLEYGLYELKLTVTIMNMPSLTSSSSVFVQINPSGITANLIPYSTSMVTRGTQQDLQLNPGSYSVDYDESQFNATNWKYKYYCRIYGLYMFPNVQGMLLTIDDVRNDSSNPSCLSNRTGWQFENSVHSSITLLPGTLASNRTYQFMVQMENRRNSSLQATGYILVNVEDTRPQMILIGCVIWTLCVPNLEFQLVNPTTQVALFSVCAGNCITNQNITWNVYYGALNSSSNTTKWTLFNQINAYRDIWFFGMNTSNFTSTNQLFLSNPHINLWRFEVVYTFSYETSLSSLNFVINKPPYNGSCSIYPLNGTTTTPFDISCLNWFDEDGIKDYTISVWTDDPSQRITIAFSSISTFQVRLPAGDNQTSSVHLFVQIRDTLDCITELNISSVIVISDTEGITNLINDIQSVSNATTTNPLLQILASGNQNVVGQLITSLSQEFNKMNEANLDKALSSTSQTILITASISISPLGIKDSQQFSIPFNESALIEFNKEVNSQANIREYLMKFTTKLLITTSSSIKLQATSLAQLTKATNQLTRTTLMAISDRCYQLTLALYSWKTRISFEEVQTSATQLIQCVANVLSAANGPIQERTLVLNRDVSQATTFPADYDTNLESEWSNPNLFADGDDFSWETMQKNRNTYYQKQLANKIMYQAKEIISLLSSILNIHLNIGQDIVMNTTQVFMSLETKSFDALLNKLIKQVGNAHIQLPQTFQSNMSNHSKISIRSTMEPLASHGNTKSRLNTNVSASISLSILDENGNEVSLQTDSNHPIEIIIPRDPNFNIPPMILQNVTSGNFTPHNHLFVYHYLNLTSSLPISVHIEIQPLNKSIGYLFIYKFDQIPQLNSSTNQIDGWTLFCPSNLQNESIYTYFIDNQRTVDHQAVILGMRELNSTEMNFACSNSSTAYLPITDKRFNFISDYQLRIYTSGCYYLDKNNQWKSDGLRVGSLTNHHETQCFSTHLTSFANGFTVLPETINWKYVFANADFMRNKTIYLTVICIFIIYILLMIYARFKDRKDLEKLGVTPLPDNQKPDQYLYQIIVFTGQRKNAGTKSNVYFVLHGDKDETDVRRLADPHRLILQRGSIDAFIMSVPKSLGLFNCIRIWHDNSGKGSPSWFLKYVIIRDLQTMEKSHFICQRWFAVEKDDGKIERVLPVAAISDGHLWFSIFSRPPSNQFTRVQRCTCCFVLLFTSMFLNIMYYDLSNETNTAQISLGLFYITTQQIVIGIIIEFFALIPSLLLIQLFRRLRSRQKSISPLHQALYKIEPNIQIANNDKKDKNMSRSSLTFPWWWIFITYGLCIMLLAVSILFIIARGIEFGDLKTQKWLTSILSGFFSSILLSQPLKIICVAIFLACFCRNSNDDREATEFLNNDHVDLDHDEEYLHSNEEKYLFSSRSATRVNRLDEGEISWARHERLKEIQMWSIIRETAIYFCFLSLLCVVIYANHHSNSYFQVQHLRKYFHNSRQFDLDYTRISTIHQYWNWLEHSFVDNIRAQQWYNGQPPRNLSGFLNDKSNRLIGWPTIRQVRVKSTTCSFQSSIVSTCTDDYTMFNEDKQSYQPRWRTNITQTFTSSIRQSFIYQSSDELNTYSTIGDHGIYAGGGYVYEFRGRLIDLQSNLSELHRLEWIDNRTRAVIIQMTLYNPNIALFTAVTFLFEILSTGGVYPTTRFEPLNISAFSSIFQLICFILYMMIIIYFMFIEIRFVFELKWKYLYRFWSYIEVGIIVCSWISVGFYIWRYYQFQQIGESFKETNGFVYINLQLTTYINDLLTYLYGFCCFFGTIKCVHLCRFNQRLCLFIQTLHYAARELLSFAMMFSIVFLSFVSLFYLLFISKLGSCSSLLTTSQMLFEMTLMKFDAHQLSGAAAFLGPFCFTLFIIFVVFICMSMFLSIINENFHRAKDNVNSNKQIIFSFMFKRFLHWTGLIQLNEDEVRIERDTMMRSEYYDSIERFPEKIDQLLDALNRVYMTQKIEKEPRSI